MSEHDRFEELIAAAAAGQISESDLAALESHQGECDFCRNLLPELGEIRDACLAESPRLDPGTPHVHFALRRRILGAFETAGARFSESVRREMAGKPAGGGFGYPRPMPWWARVAAVVAIVAAGSIAGYEIGEYRAPRLALPAPSVASPPAIVIESDASALEAVQEQLASATSERDRYEQSAAALASQRDQLAARVSGIEQQLAALETASNRSATQNADLTASLAQARSALARAQTQMNGLQQAQESAQAHSAEAERRVQEMQQKVSEETASLDRESRLLQAGRDIRDIVSARNLHIIDVADVGYQGASKPFGRIFYTEHRSLVFYAYDLRKPKTSQAFYVWGTQAGDPSSTRVLGMLFNDAKDRRTWDFRFDDPAILSQINTVFVTLEPNERPGIRPKGTKVLEAYLGTPANHP